MTIVNKKKKGGSDVLIHSKRAGKGRAQSSSERQAIVDHIRTALENV